MATIFVAWELGGGLGHVSPLQPIVDGLAQRGHDVVVALRNVNQSTMVFQHPSVRVVQSPFLTTGVRQAHRIQYTFAHILHNMGFDRPEELAARCHAWNTLYDLVSPDVIVFDHSPTALLASWQRNVARVCMGLGFCCPPPCQWMPNWRPEAERDLEKIHRGEQHVLNVVNTLMRQWEQPPFAVLSELFGRADETMVNSFAEIDHFQPPRERGYWGTLPSMPGHPPEWSKAPGKRVFAYLKRGKNLAELLRRLADFGHPTLVFVPGISEQAQADYSTDSLRVVAQPQEVSEVVKQCEVVVSCGGHGLTAETLLAGKASLLLPQHTEQRLTAFNIKRIRAGLAANSNKPEHVVEQLRLLLEHPELSAGAATFADKYSDHDPMATRMRMIDRIEALAQRQVQSP